jgi:hypothetical protein
MDGVQVVKPWGLGADRMLPEAGGVGNVATIVTGGVGLTVSWVVWVGGTPNRVASKTGKPEASKEGGCSSTA